MAYGQIVDAFTAAGQDYVTVWDLERNTPLTGVVPNEIDRELAIGDIVSFNSKNTIPDGPVDEPIPEIKALASEEIPDDLTGYFTDRDLIQVLIAYTRSQSQVSAELAVRNIVGWDEPLNLTDTFSDKAGVL